MQENKMGTMPVHRLLITMSVPLMISMLVQALYNIVDSMFVAMINEDALTAVSLAFPMQNLMIAVATGTGVGVNALISRRLGQKQQEMANRTANNAIFLAICIFLLFIGWQNFYVENSLTRALAKVGKDYSMLIYVLHYAVLQALSRCFKGRRSLLAMGYQQYGMMFVFAVTVVMVAVYVNARACLKNHSRKL